MKCNCLVFAAIFVSLFPNNGFSDEAVPEFRLFLYNDSMGIGWAQDWDDHRTFGAGASYFTGPWRLHLDYIAFTARAKTPAETIRSDLIDITVAYVMPWSISCIPFVTEFKAGAGFSGNLAGDVIQAAWHNMLGILRPVPTAYENEWQFWPKASVLTGISTDAEIFYYILTGIKLELSALSFDAIAGFGEKISRARTELFVSYCMPIHSFDSFLSGKTAENEAGPWIGWDVEVSGFVVRNRFNAMSGILDYQIGISTRAWDNLKDMHSTRRLALGSFTDRLCLASTYTIGPHTPVFGAGAPDFRLRLQMQNGERIGKSVSDPVVHMQNITAGIECPLLLDLSEWKTGLVFYAGPGLRTEQTYMPVTEKAMVISEQWGFCIEAEIGLRVEWHAEWMAPSFYGIEIAAATIQSLIGNPHVIKSDYMIVIRVIFGVK